MVLLCPDLSRIEELAASPRVARVDRDLLDERVPIQRFDQHVGHGVIVLIDGHQGTSVLLEPGQSGNGRRIVIGNGVHAEVPKRPAGVVDPVDSPTTLPTLLPPGWNADDRQLVYAN